MSNPSKSTLGLPDPGSTLDMSVTFDERRDPVMSVGIFFHSLFLRCATLISVGGFMPPNQHYLEQSNPFFSLKASHAEPGKSY